MKLISILALTLSSLAASVAAAAPVFNATLTVGSDTRFVLIGESGKPSAWLKLGDSFDGYTLKAFDAKANALDLEQGGKVTRVTIAPDAKVADGALAATPATLADAQALLNKMQFEKMMDRIFAQQRAGMGRMVEQMASRMNIPANRRDDVVAFQKKVMDEMMSSLNGADMKDEVAKIYSEVFSKEELDGLSAFYSTPTGEALTDKQPLVQQKMQEVMMPKIMAAMPKIQQMAQEFAAQEQAKMKAAAPAAAPAPAPAPAAAPAPASEGAPK